MFDWGRGFMFQSGKDNITPYFILLTRLGVWVGVFFVVVVVVLSFVFQL